MIHICEVCGEQKAITYIYIEAEKVWACRFCRADLGLATDECEATTDNGAAQSLANQKTWNVAHSDDYQ